MMLPFKTSFALALEQAVVARTVQAPFMGWTCGVSLGGEEIARVSGGWARAPYESNPRRMTPDTPLHIASVAKPVTVIGVLKLIDLWNAIQARWTRARGFPPYDYSYTQAGISRDFGVTAAFCGRVYSNPDVVISVDTTLRSLFKDLLPATIGTGTGLVTIKQQIGHAGGLRVADLDANDPAAMFIPKAFARAVAFPPGTSSDYQNNNYVVLRYLIEHVAGQSFEPFMRLQVFEPCQAQRFLASSSDPDEALYYHVLGWSGLGDGPKSGSNWDQWASLGALGWFVPAADVSRVLDRKRLEPVLGTTARAQFFDDGLGTGTSTSGRGFAYRGHNGFWEWNNGSASAEVIFSQTTGLSACLVANVEAPAGNILRDALDALAPSFTLGFGDPSDGCQVVRLSTGVGGDWIRWTDDGTAPSAASRSAPGPLAFRSNVTLRASLFDGVKLVLGPVQTAVTANAPWHTAALPDAPGLQRGLSWAREDGVFTSAATPTFAAPAATGVVQQATRPADIPLSNYALRFQGYFAAARDDVYTFEAWSDDGSIVTIAGVKVVDNDGTHGKRSRWGAIALRAGLHAIEIRYFQGGGGQDFAVRGSVNGAALTVLDASVLRRPI